MELANGKVILHAGDCLEVLATLAENSVDAVVTDPPYELGFMGKSWDASGIAFCPETWLQVLRVLKPGGHMVAFGAPKNYHRLACAIEDAGFEIRDSLMWVFGTGFPKSMDVSKAIDKAAGAEREKIAVGTPVKRMIPRADQDATGSWIKDNGREYQPGYELPATDAAREWQGWGTALKPAYEPIVLARKPLSEKTVAANVLRWGTGALNIDACRIAADDGQDRSRPPRTPNAILGGGKGTNLTASAHNAAGRWPANLCHDGSQGVLDLFPQSKGGHDPKKSKGSPFGGENNDERVERFWNDEGSAARFFYSANFNDMETSEIYAEELMRIAEEWDAEDKERVAYARWFGSKLIARASEIKNQDVSQMRFFYSAKASKQDRAGSKHPTVKPVALMQWLVRMVTPPNGKVLDPFAGSGTTGQAAVNEGFQAVLIEREEEYRADIARRFDV